MSFGFALGNKSHVGAVSDVIVLEDQNSAIPSA